MQIEIQSVQKLLTKEYERGQDSCVLHERARIISILDNFLEFITYLSKDKSEIKRSSSASAIFTLQVIKEKIQK